VFYTDKINRLCEYRPFTQLTMDRIDELAIQAYKDSRLKLNKAVVTINRELGTLRKALRFAVDCNLITKAPRVRLLPNEHQRTFVLDGELEKQYMALADYPLKQVAILMLDLGLRPEEAVSLRKSDVSGTSYSPDHVPDSKKMIGNVTDGGIMTVRKGKTAAARRSLPQTERTREVFELCFALHQESEWVFPGSKNGHYTAGAISNAHAALRKKYDLPKEFVLYSCRHTYASRLAEVSNGDVFLLMRALGHSNPKMCARYVHPRADYLTLISRQKEILDKVMRGEEEVHTETSSRTGLKH